MGLERVDDDVPVTHRLADAFGAERLEFVLVRAELDPGGLVLVTDRVVELLFEQRHPTRARHQAGRVERTLLDQLAVLVLPPGQLVVAVGVPPHVGVRVGIVEVVRERIGGVLPEVVTELRFPSVEAGLLGDVWVAEIERLAEPCGLDDVRHVRRIDAADDPMLPRPVDAVAEVADRRQQVVVGRHLVRREHLQRGGDLGVASRQPDHHRVERLTRRIGQELVDDRTGPGRQGAERFKDREQRLVGEVDITTHERHLAEQARLDDRVLERFGHDVLEVAVVRLVPDAGHLPLAGENDHRLVLVAALAIRDGTGDDRVRVPDVGQCSGLRRRQRPHHRGHELLAPRRGSIDGSTVSATSDHPSPRVLVAEQDRVGLVGCVDRELGPADAVDHRQVVADSDALLDRSAQEHPVAVEGVERRVRPAGVIHHPLHPADVRREAGVTATGDRRDVAGQHVGFTTGALELDRLVVHPALTDRAGSEVLAEAADATTQEERQHLFTDGAGDEREAEQHGRLPHLVHRPLEHVEVADADHPGDVAGHGVLAKLLQ